MPAHVHEMYRQVGMNYVDTILMPAIEGNIKDVIGKWNAQDLVANRAAAASDILNKLQTQLTSKYINVTSFQIIDINYSEVFERAIESKVTLIYFDVNCVCSLFKMSEAAAALFATKS